MRNELLFCISLNLLVSSFLIVSLSIKPVHASAPYLQFVREYYYCPLINSNPHGKFNLIVDICKLVNDGSSDYDWYFYSNIPAGSEGMRMQTVPGCVAYGSNWETAHIWSKHTVRGAGTYRWLVDYGPTTTNGWDSSTESASVTITSEGETGVSFGQSYTYQIPYIKVLDYSDFSAHRAYWQHNFNTERDPKGAPSDTTYLARPAFIVKTRQNQWSYVDGWYQVEFGHPVWFWWEYQPFEAIVYLDAQRVGDGDIPTKITIQSYRTTDIYSRSHGMAIDQDLPENWWQYSGYEFKVTSQAFIYETWVYLTSGSHFVEYAASGYVPNYAWHAKIYVNGILKAEGDVGRNNANHLRAYFSV